MCWLQMNEDLNIEYQKLDGWYTVSTTVPTYLTPLFQLSRMVGKLEHLRKKIRSVILAMISKYYFVLLIYLFVYFVLNNI